MMNSGVSGRSTGWRPGWRALAVPVILAVCVWLIWSRAQDLDWHALQTALFAVTAPQIAVSLAATWVSFWAVGRYDAVVHRWQRTGIPERLARRAGAASIAVAQTLGAGPVTGAFVRWRMLPGLSLIDAGKLSAAVAASFLGGFAVLTGAILALTADWLPAAPRVAIGFSLLLLLGIYVLRPRFSVFGRPITLPPVPAVAAILGLVALDTGAAAVALYVLLPDPAMAAIPFATAYLLALGAGLVSGTPGGIGPFELTLLALCPLLPEAELLAAVLVFRVTYYAIPAVWAVFVMARPAPKTSATVAADPVALPSCTLDRATEAEAALVYQGYAQLWNVPASADHLVLQETSHTLTALGGSLGGDPALGLAELRQQARSQNRIACLYKCAPRRAAHARRAGYKMVLWAHEAIVTPAAYSLTGRARAGLRRKLRKAEQDGVTLLTRPPLPEYLARLNATWVAENGPERGFSMGRFCPRYLRRQQVFVAQANGKPLGFVSFHQTESQWTLDLIRIPRSAPDGTAHFLINAAIEAARAAGIPSVSLAAVPATHCTAIPMAMWRKIDKRAGGPGLRQFKGAFATSWQPRYIGATSGVNLLIAAADIARAINTPPPLPDRAAADAQPAHHNYDNYSFVVTKQTCHRAP